MGEGFLSADGVEEIRLRYDFDSPAFVNRASGTKEEIKKVEFRLVLGNDYQVWVTSDSQLNAGGESVLLLVAQAKGNVQDKHQFADRQFRTMACRPPPRSGEEP